MVSGCIGPRGDGYLPGSMMTAEQAAEYHHAQVRDLADAGAALVTSFTFSYADEGVGVATAAAQVGVPAVVGFTVESDGRLPSGETLAEAVEKVDTATDRYPSWFMVNCAHPDHIAPGLVDGPWLERVGAVRVNASRLSHAELDEATELDGGDPVELAGGVRDPPRVFACPASRRRLLRDRHPTRHGDRQTRSSNPSRTEVPLTGGR